MHVQPKQPKRRNCVKIPYNTLKITFVCGLTDLYYIVCIVLPSTIWVVARWRKKLQMALPVPTKLGKKICIFWQFYSVLQVYLDYSLHSLCHIGAGSSVKLIYLILFNFAIRFRVFMYGLVVWINWATGLIENSPYKKFSYTTSNKKDNNTEKTANKQAI